MGRLGLVRRLPTGIHMAKKRLGIDALFQTSVPSAGPKLVSHSASDSNEVALGDLAPGPGQPRSHFGEAGLEELADSIRVHGVLQPILVRPAAKGGYEIVAGERRWRAARLAGLDTVPVRVIDLADDAILGVAMVENLQREDLNPLEEAEGYLDLLRLRLAAEEAFAPYSDEADPRTGVVRLLRALNNRLAGNTKDDVVLTLEPAVSEVFAGVGRITWSSFVAHRLPLLSLPEDVAAALRARLLDYTKARLIARITAERVGGDEDRARVLRRDVVDRAVAERISVRALQAEIATMLGEERPVRLARRRDEPATPDVESVGAKIAEVRERLAELEIGRCDAATLRDIGAALDALLSALD